MKASDFRSMIESRWADGKFLCVGLDSELAKIPYAAYRGGREDGVNIQDTIVEFNRAIVDATYDLVCAYKPNIAFYEAHGDNGMKALGRTMTIIRHIAPGVPVILDAKRGDVCGTNERYAEEAFGHFRADAVTVNPYFGKEALRPFLDRKDKGIFVVCRTSNPGAGELQCIAVESGPVFSGREPQYRPLYEVVAERVVRRWNANGNCGLVVGATHSRELADIRSMAGDIPILIPGIGAQGGDLESTVKGATDSRNRGIIVNASRSVIFASSERDFPDAARLAALSLHERINECREAKAAGKN